jgi:cobalt-zinc-cadmium efflux system protein
MSPHSHSAAGGRARLQLVFLLTAAYTLVEFGGALFTGSLALLADAGHMFTDVFALGLALFAIWLTQRPADTRRTFGYYRAEILAAALNAVLLFGISGYILYEAWQRFQNPPEVQSLPMLVIAALGLLVNLAGVWLLGGHSGESLNVRAAFLELAADLLGSLGVIIAAAIMYFTGWRYADPLFSALIGLFIIPRTWHVLREALDVLLEAVPSHINLPEIRRALTEAPGAVSAHDLHVWTITSGYVSLSAHVVVEGDACASDVLTGLNTILRERFDIDHTTIQIEHPEYTEENSRCCD